MLCLLTHFIDRFIYWWFYCLDWSIWLIIISLHYFSLLSYWLIYLFIHLIISLSFYWSLPIGWFISSICLFSHSNWFDLFDWLISLFSTYWLLYLIYLSYWWFLSIWLVDSLTSLLLYLSWLLSLLLLFLSLLACLVDYLIALLIGLFGFIWLIVWSLTIYWFYGSLSGVIISLTFSIVWSLPLDWVILISLLISLDLFMAWFSLSIGLLVWLFYWFDLVDWFAVAIPLSIDIE